MTDRQTELVLEAARQLVAAAARHPDVDYRDPIELEARLIALAFAVRAYDRAEAAWDGHSDACRCEVCRYHD